MPGGSAPAALLILSTSVLHCWGVDATLREEALISEHQPILAYFVAELTIDDLDEIGPDVYPCKPPKMFVEVNGTEHEMTLKEHDNPAPGEIAPQSSYQLFELREQFAAVGTVNPPAPAYRYLMKGSPAYNCNSEYVMYFPTEANFETGDWYWDLTWSLVPGLGPSDVDANSISGSNGYNVSFVETTPPAAPGPGNVASVPTVPSFELKPKEVDLCIGESRDIGSASDLLEIAQWTSQAPATIAVQRIDNRTGRVTAAQAIVPENASVDVTARAAGFQFLTGTVAVKTKVFNPAVPSKPIVTASQTDTDYAGVDNNSVTVCATIVDPANGCRGTGTTPCMLDGIVQIGPADANGCTTIGWQPGHEHLASQPCIWARWQDPSTGAFVLGDPTRLCVRNSLAVPCALTAANCPVPNGCPFH